MLSIEAINMLCLQGESDRVDFKLEQYRFLGGSPEDKSELLKDILAMSNVARIDAAYILIGVEELPNKAGRIVGIRHDDVIDDAMLHQFVNQKTNVTIPFSSYVVASGVLGKDCIQVIEIAPCNEMRPFYLRKDFGKLRASLVYYRDGTSTAIATPDQIKKMGEENAIGMARPVVELPESVVISKDWSAVVVESANYDDLDTEAIAKARKGFAEAHIGRLSVEEVEGWPLPVFLEKTRLAVGGKLTRAALLLLGKSEASIKLSPYVAQLTWNLSDGVSAYEHFGPPFLLTTTRLYRKIRNFQIKILPKGSLLPVVVPKYTEKVVLEPLHNCIAHQDYTRLERILVTEYPDSIEFENAGSFYEGVPEDYIDGFKRPRTYRNRLLAEAMAELHMIDAMGYGIRDVYHSQRIRYLPMPDYKLSGDHVAVRVYGNVVDEAYSRLLISETSISIADVVSLDRVQKHLPIDRKVAAHLRKLRYIEGRGKQVRISSRIAAMTDKRAEYIQLKATEDANLKRMILDYIAQFGGATRSDIDTLLQSKMHEALSEDEKRTKVGNLLTALRVGNKIVNQGTRGKPQWVLVKE